MGNKRSKGKKINLRSVVSIILAILFLIFGFTSILQPRDGDLHILNIPHEDSILWFGLAIVVFLIPYLREISFNGNSFKLMDELRDTKKSIDEIKVQISNQKTKSREELILAYSRYLELLSDDDRRSEVKKLNEIYFEEMNVSISLVKRVLRSLNYKISDEANSITIELVKGLEVFQKDNGLPSDGIFGYWTYDKLRPFIDNTDDASMHE